LDETAQKPFGQRNGEANGQVFGGFTAPGVRVESVHASWAATHLLSKQRYGLSSVHMLSSKSALLHSAEEMQ
jgi:hypothetical protein